jgi:hypothetical protein
MSVNVSDPRELNGATVTGRHGEKLGKVENVYGPGPRSTRRSRRGRCSPTTHRPRRRGRGVPRSGSAKPPPPPGSPW